MRPLKLLVVILVLLGFVVPPTYAGAGETGLRVRVQTPAFDLTETGVAVRGYGFDDEPGALQLPVHGAVVELPPDGRWELDFVSSGARVLEQRISVRAVPVPLADQAGAAGGPESADSGAVLVEDRPDPAIYGKMLSIPPLR